mmetsp:Transcript_17633/g.51580  ORF Transcript_17633/g.51580 Transcript_17633/m.51580 type:complete len:342 (+) Transcript_17633:1042-2067(+)
MMSRECICISSTCSSFCSLSLLMCESSLVRIWSRWGSCFSVSSRMPCMAASRSRLRVKSTSRCALVTDCLVAAVAICLEILRISASSWSPFFTAASSCFFRAVFADLLSSSRSCSGVRLVWTTATFLSSRSCSSRSSSTMAWNSASADRRSPAKERSSRSMACWARSAVSSACILAITWSLTASFSRMSWRRSFKVNMSVALLFAEIDKLRLLECSGMRTSECPASATSSSSSPSSSAASRLAMSLATKSFFTPDALRPLSERSCLSSDTVNSINSLAVAVSTFSSSSSPSSSSSSSSSSIGAATAFSITGGAERREFGRRVCGTSSSSSSSGASSSMASP